MACPVDGVTYDITAGRKALILTDSPEILSALRPASGAPYAVPEIISTSNTNMGYAYLKSNLTQPANYSDTTTLRLTPLFHCIIFPAGYLERNFIIEVINQMAPFTILATLLRFPVLN